MGMYHSNYASAGWWTDSDSGSRWRVRSIDDQAMRIVFVKPYTGDAQSVCSEVMSSIIIHILV